MVLLSTCFQSQGLCVEKFVFVWEYYCANVLMNPFIISCDPTEIKNIYVSGTPDTVSSYVFFLCSCNLRSLKICRILTSSGLFCHPGFRSCDDPWAEFNQRRRFCEEIGRAKCVRRCSGLRPVAALFSPLFPLL